MRAIVRTRYGSADVLQLRQVPKTTPREHEVQVRIHATSVNATDLENMRGVLMVRIGALLRSKYGILGADVAGRIEAVGRRVTQYRPGDSVFGDLSPLRCSFGAFAEYVCAPEDALTPKPAGLTFEEAAAATSTAVLALQALRHKREIQPGQKVLINGAGGSVGTFAVQIAKSYGAEVTGVDAATKLDLLRTIGANRLINYAREDFTRSG